MNRYPTLTLATLLALALMPHGAALHCNGNIITIDADAETLYLDDRSSGPGEINHWLYLESNGVAGLQSGYEGPFICDPTWPFCPFGDRCSHAQPDLLII